MGRGVSFRVGKILVFFGGLAFGAPPPPPAGKGQNISVFWADSMFSGRSAACFKHHLQMKSFS